MIDKSDVQLRSSLGKHVINLHDRTRDLERRGWQLHGRVAVSINDQRLDEWERQFLVNLGTRLYGERDKC